MTQAEAASQISYNPENGTFVWLRSGRVAGGLNVDGYWRLSVLGKQYKAHRLAFLMMEGCFPDGDVDHINGNRSDNRWANLRAASRSENMQNVHNPASNSTGFIGVCRKGRRFSARIKIDGRSHSLGCFDTPAAASEAYRFAKPLVHPFSN